MEKREVYELMERFNSSIKYFPKRNGINYTETLIMTGLAISEESGKMICVSDVAQHLRVTKSAASQMLEKLEEKGLIRKYRKENNKKTVYVKLTDEALKQCDERKRKLSDMIDMLSKEMGDDMEEFLRLNNKFIGALENVCNKLCDGQT